MIPVTCRGARAIWTRGKVQAHLCGAWVGNCACRLSPEPLPAGPDLPAAGPCWAQHSVLTLSPSIAQVHGHGAVVSLLVPAALAPSRGPWAAPQLPLVTVQPGRSRALACGPLSLLQRQPDGAGKGCLVLPPCGCSEVATRSLVRGWCGLLYTGTAGPPPATCPPHPVGTEAAGLTQELSLRTRCTQQWGLGRSRVLLQH